MPLRATMSSIETSRPRRERLRRIALPMEDEALVLLLIEQMRESGLVHSHHGWLHLPEHKAGFTDEQQAVWHKVETLFGDDPWWVRDLAREVHVEESLMCAVPAVRRSRDDYCDRRAIVTTATIALCSSPSGCASWIGCAVQPARRISAIP